MKKLLLILLFLLPNLSHAAIARDSSLGDQVTGSATSLTYSFTNTAGNLLIITCQGVFTSGASNITGVTYAGTAMTMIGGYDGSGGSGYNRYTYQFYLLAPATGANNVVVSSSPAGFIDCNTESYSGVKQTGNPTQTDAGRYAGTNGTITFSPTTGTGRWAMMSIVSRNSQDAGCFANTTASLAAGGYVTNPSAAIFGTFDSNGTSGASYTAGFSGCTQSATAGIMTTWDAVVGAIPLTSILSLVRSFWIW